MLSSGPMKGILVIVLTTIAMCISAQAQEFAPESVNMTPDQLPPPEPKASPTPIPDIPEISTLDQAFKRTSIGKEADESRQRVEIRRLQNQIANDASLVATKKDAEAASTDLGKRERLRNY